MSVESIIRVFAGSVILTSLGLFLLVGPWGLALAAFVALNLIQSAFTGFCPAASMITRLGLGKPSTTSVAP